MQLSVFALSIILSALVASVSADLWIPTVVEPSEGAVWIIGHQYNITWDASNPPVNITDSLGHAWLAKDRLEYFDDEHFLAGNFPLRQGWVTVIAPNVEAADDYQVLLFGDSSNLGPFFTIRSA